MFTGIIKALGEVVSYDDASHVLRISCPQFAERKILGASIAIDGVCLTVSHVFNDDPTMIGFDLGQETRAITLLAKKQPKDLVNIEFALTVGDPLDGHLVQGHVDTTARVAALEPQTNGLLMRFFIDESLATLVVKKGSIAVNGVSLTVNDVGSNWFSVFLVPFTLEHTGFKRCAVGDEVHIETDILGRYVQRLTAHLNSCS